MEMPIPTQQSSGETLHGKRTVAHRQTSIKEKMHMKALVYHGKGKRAWEDHPIPAIQHATDAIVKISKTTICATDLLIVHGELPEVETGRILGHEGVGVIEEVGNSVMNFKTGDKVLISCITSCGKCTACKNGMYSHCENGGGWMLGHLVDGTHAEYVRIPFADTSLYAIPDGIDEAALTMLSDIFPAGFECGVANGQIKPGDAIAIIGAGPVGLATLLTAQFYSPAEIIMIDEDENRLEVAQMLGATRLLHSANGDVVEKVLKITGGKGVDVAIEAVGRCETFEICQSIVKAGGRIANVGMHGKSIDLHLDKLWAKNVTITTKLVDTASTPMLLKVVQSGRLRPQKLITHRFSMHDILKAYDTFENATEEKAIKVLLTNER